jgi:L-alanine-DL-glutamate epimerase-like enolase superfamily enzyme
LTQKSEEENKVKIIKVSSELYRVPLIRPAKDARHGVMNQIELVIVKVDTTEGISGCGYTYTIGIGGTAIKDMIEDYLGDELIGANPLMVEQIWEKMWWKTHWVGRGGLVSFALSALDIALWDIIAKHSHCPLYQILGGYNRRIPAYGSGVDLNLSDEELVAQVEGFIDEGFHAVKIKVGRDEPKEDIRRVRLVRQAIGDKVELLIDVNMKWTVSQTVRMGRALEEYGVGWIEEPLVPEDVDGHHKVAEALSLPIAIGENLRTLNEFQHYITAKAVDIVQLDVCTVGGITQWRKVAVLANAFNLGISTHYAEEIHVHLLASIPNALIAERHAYRLDHVLERPLTFQKGGITPPEIPGHGMVFDEKKLLPYHIK